MQLSMWAPTILSLWALLSLASSASLAYPGNLLTPWGTQSPPSQAPFRTANTLDPKVVALSPTSSTALNGFLSPTWLLTSQSAPSTFSTPLQESASCTLLKSLLANNNPVAQAEAQLANPAVTPNLLNSCESAAVNTLSPWMVAEMTCAMTLVPVILATSLYLGVLYLSLSWMMSLFLAQQSVFPSLLLLNLV